MTVPAGLPGQNCARFPVSRRECQSHQPPIPHTFHQFVRQLVLLLDDPLVAAGPVVDDQFVEGERRRLVDVVPGNIDQRSQTLGGAGARDCHGNVEVTLIDFRVPLDDGEKNAEPAGLKKLPDMRIEVANSAGAKDIMIALVSEDAAALSQAAEAIGANARG